MEHICDYSTPVFPIQWRREKIAAKALSKLLPDSEVLSEQSRSL